MKTNHKLFAVLFFIWIARSLWIFGLAEPFLSYDTTQHYLPMAENLAHGHGLSIAQKPPYTPTALRLPGYPAFLAVVYVWGGEHQGLVVFIHVLLEGLAILTLFKLCYQLTTSKIAATTSSLLFLIWPYNLTLNGQFMREPIFIPILIFAFATFIKALRTGHLKTLTASAVLLVLALFFREDAIYFLPIVCGFWAWFFRRDLKRAIAGVTILSGITVAALTPWILRNQRLFHRFIPLASISHVHVMAKHSIAYQETDPPEPYRFPLLAEADAQIIRDAERKVFRAYDLGATPQQFDEAYADLASVYQKYRRHYPLLFLKFTAVRFIKYVGSSRVDSLPGYSPHLLVKMLSMTFHFGTYFFGILGFLTLWRLLGFLIPVCLFPAAAVAIVGYVPGRYELHIFPLLFLGCGLSVHYVAQRFFGTQTIRQTQT